jgi:nucleoid DNA-binding protein
MRVDIGELGIKDMYKLYCKTRKEPVEYSLFAKVIRSYNKRCMEEIIEKGHSIKINHIGKIRVKKSKQRYSRMMLDFKEFNETGKKVFHLNEHSDDMFCWFYWNKGNCRIEGKTPYCFTATRGNKRKLAAKLKEPNGHTTYFK